jgi:hypothetical protein
MENIRFENARRTAGLDPEIAELLAGVSMSYRSSVAHLEVAAAQHSLPKTPAVERRILLGCAVAGSARYLESALEFTRYALECDTSVRYNSTICGELLALKRTTAQRLD